jgi:hypothetical protein
VMVVAVAAVHGRSAMEANEANASLLKRQV